MIIKDVVIGATILMIVLYTPTNKDIEKLEKRICELEKIVLKEKS